MMRFRRQPWCWVLLIAASFLGAAGLRAGDWPGHGHECREACEPVCKSCVPVPGVRKETRVVYCCKELDICLPHRCLWDLFRRHGDTCGQSGDCANCRACPGETCPQCERRPRRKMVLLKRIVPVECPTFQCEVDCLPGNCSTLEIYEPSVPDAPAPPVPPSASLRNARTTR